MCVLRGFSPSFWRLCFRSDLLSYIYYNWSPQARGVMSRTEQLVLIRASGFLTVPSVYRHASWSGTLRGQARFVVCARMTESGHLCVNTSLARLWAYCIRSGVEPAVQEFLRQYVNYANTEAGAIVPHSLAWKRPKAVVGEVLPTSVHIWEMRRETALFLRNLVCRRIYW